MGVVEDVKPEEENAVDREITDTREERKRMWYQEQESRTGNF